MLTPKQFELLTFIDRRLKDTGVSPSFDEMKEAVHLKSKSGVHRLVRGLEERRFIRRLPNRARALEVLRTPQAAPASKKTSSSLPPKPPINHLHTSIPLYGRIAAGLAIEAVNDLSQKIDVPSSLLGGGDYYALEVAGDSMIEAGILDGDIAIIRHQNTTTDGTIVVAFIDDGDVTLKTLYRQDGKIILEPANRTYQPQIYAPHRVKIQGVLAGLLRTY